MNQTKETTVEEPNENSKHKQFFYKSSEFHVLNHLIVLINLRRWMKNVFNLL